MNLFEWIGYHFMKGCLEAIQEYKVTDNPGYGGTVYKVLEIR